MKCNFTVYFVVFFVLIFVASCDEDDRSTLGADIINTDTSNSGFLTEVFEVNIKNNKLDSVQTSGLAGNLLGNYKDENFGDATYSVLSKVALSEYNLNFGESPEIESIIVDIPYFSNLIATNAEGGKTYELDSIYRPSKPIKFSIFYSDYFLSEFEGDQVSTVYNTAKFTKSATASDIGVPGEAGAINNLKLYEFVEAFVPSSNELTITTPNTEELCEDGIETKTAPGIRVSLDLMKNDGAIKNFFTSKFIDKQGNSVLSNLNNFQEFFRGLYFEADNISVDGSLLYLNFNNAKITVRYSYGAAQSDTCAERQTRTFEINCNNTFKVNLIEKEAVSGIDYSSNQNLLVKGGPGAVPTLSIFSTNVDKERLKALGDDQVILNEAYIKFYINENFALEHKNSNRLFVFNKATGYPVADMFQSNTFDVDPDNSFISHLGKLEKDEFGEYYRIRLTEHVKNLLYVENAEHIELSVCVTPNVNLPIFEAQINPAAVVSAKVDGETINLPMGSIISPKGIIFHGPNTLTDQRLQLVIKYTKP